MMTACDDRELFNWLRNAASTAGSFLRSLAEAGLSADPFNYALLRPVLLKIKDKYPKYDNWPIDQEKEDALWNEMLGRD